MVILVSSPYDTFILQDDGQLTALILGQLGDLDLYRMAPTTFDRHRSFARIGAAEVGRQARVWESSRARRKTDAPP